MIPHGAERIKLVKISFSVYSTLENLATCWTLRWAPDGMVETIHYPHSEHLPTPMQSEASMRLHENITFDRLHGRHSLSNHGMLPDR